jgi:hypothetical protein
MQDIKTESAVEAALSVRGSNQCKFQQAFDLELLAQANLTRSTSPDR